MSVLQKIVNSLSHSIGIIITCTFIVMIFVQIMRVILS